MKNKIALVGMPGCGKTTIGKMLNEKMKVDLIDLDEYIVEIEGKSIEDIFKKGEAEFRRCETNALKNASLINKPVIVSTGGGVIKSQANIDALRKNFFVIFIDRPVDDIYDDIDIDSRPLLKNNKGALLDLYNERYNLYKTASHICINNDTCIEEVVDNIIKEIMIHKALN